MGRKEIYTDKAVFMIKCMLGAYVLTAGLLLLLAFLLYRFGLSEKVVSICITAIYIIVTFFAGMLVGKREGKRKFLWGLAMGVRVKKSSSRSRQWLFRGELLTWRLARESDCETDAKF